MRLRSDVNALRGFGDDKARQYRMSGMVKARIFLLLVDLQEFFFQIYGRGDKKK